MKKLFQKNLESRIQDSWLYGRDCQRNLLKIGSLSDRRFEDHMVANSDSMASLEVQNAIPSLQVSVSDFYNGKTVFITGGTGFMGKVLLEKLLRSCSGVAKIYLLIRPKKGQQARERLQQLLSSPVSLVFYNFFLIFFVNDELGTMKSSAYLYFHI